MENYLKQSYEDYQLLLLAEKHIKTIFNWNIQEKNFEYYTCRPLKLSKSFEEYASKTLSTISEGKEIIYVLVSQGDCNKLLNVKINHADFIQKHQNKFTFNARVRLNNLLFQNVN